MFPIISIYVLVMYSNSDKIQYVFCHYVDNMELLKYMYM